MNTSSKKILSCAVAAAALAIIGALLLSFGGLYEFDAPLGYFRHDSLYSVCLYAVLVLGCAAGLFLLISERKSCCAGRTLPSSRILPVFAALCSVAVLTSTVYEMINTLGTLEGQYIAVTYVSWALSVPTAVSLLYTAFSNDSEPAAFPCLLSFFPPLYFASRVLVDYFDRSIAVNSPVKTLAQITLISFMLMLTAETGISLGRAKIYPRYLFMLCVSTVFGGTSGIAGIFLHLSPESFPIALPEAVIFALFTLYSAARLISAHNYGVILKSSLPADMPEMSGEKALEDEIDSILKEEEE